MFFLRSAARGKERGNSMRQTDKTKQAMPIGYQPANINVSPFNFSSAISQVFVLQLPYDKLEKRRYLSSRLYSYM